MTLSGALHFQACNAMHVSMKEQYTDASRVQQQTGAGEERSLRRKGAGCRMQEHNQQTQSATVQRCAALQCTVLCGTQPSRPTLASHVRHHTIESLPHPLCTHGLLQRTVSRIGLKCSLRLAVDACNFLPPTSPTSSYHVLCGVSFTSGRGYNPPARGDLHVLQKLPPSDEKAKCCACTSLTVSRGL
jgi:hypothetical protein